MSGCDLKMIRRGSTLPQSNSEITRRATTQGRPVCFGKTIAVRVVETAFLWDVRAVYCTAHTAQAVLDWIDPGRVRLLLRLDAHQPMQVARHMAAGRGLYHLRQPWLAVEQVPDITHHYTLFGYTARPIARHKSFFAGPTLELVTVGYRLIHYSRSICGTSGCQNLR